MQRERPFRWPFAFPRTRPDGPGADPAEKAALGARSRLVRGYRVLLLLLLGALGVRFAHAFDARP